MKIPDFVLPNQHVSLASIAIMAHLGEIWTPPIQLGCARPPHFQSYPSSSSCFPVTYLLNSLKGVLCCLMKVTESSFRTWCNVLCSAFVLKVLLSFQHEGKCQNILIRGFLYVLSQDNDYCSHILNLSWNSSNAFDLPVFPKLCSA